MPLNFIINRVETPVLRGTSGDDFIINATSLGEDYLLKINGGAGDDIINAGPRIRDAAFGTEVYGDGRKGAQGNDIVAVGGNGFIEDDRWGEVNWIGNMRGGNDVYDATHGGAYLASIHNFNTERDKIVFSAQSADLDVFIFGGEPVATLANGKVVFEIDHVGIRGQGDFGPQDVILERRASEVGRTELREDGDNDGVLLTMKYNPERYDTPEAAFLDKMHRGVFDWLNPDVF